MNQALINTLKNNFTSDVEFEKTNIGFLKAIDKKQIQLSTVENGVGETHACGSNACAAVATGVLEGWLDKSVIVKLRYGQLKVCWPDVKSAIQLTGPATYVFEGMLNHN